MMYYIKKLQKIIECNEFRIKDEYGRPIDLNGDVMSFTLHLI